MKSIHDYIKEYGKYTMLEKEFNEVDNVILSNLSYIDFFNIVPMYGDGSIKLKEAAKIFYSKHDKKDIQKNIIAVKESSLLLGELANSERFKNLELLNYEYKQTFDIQFGALCIKLPDNTMYVSFEGTDSYVSGWQEDFMLSYQFPVPAQTEAINYLNKVVKLLGPRVYVGGHSKGGNLALVSGMYCKHRVFKKIKWIYSNDGPGLRDEELNSRKYRRIESKFSHIVPEQSFIGMLFRSKPNYVVIKSNKKRYMQHNNMNWIVEDGRFIKTELSEFSIRFHEAMNRWLDKLDNDKRKEFTLTFFSILKKAEIEDLNEIREAKIKKTFRILKEMKNISKENRSFLTSTLMGLYQEWKG